MSCAGHWGVLVQFATSSSADVRLGIVIGRRRPGKTYVLDAAANTFGGFFFTATDATETDSLAVKGYDTEQMRLTCYSGARFALELADRAAGDPLIQLVGLEDLCA
jgi:hypothetical protein